MSATNFTDEETGREYQFKDGQWLVKNVQPKSQQKTPLPMPSPALQAMLAQQKEQPAPATNKAKDVDELPLPLPCWLPEEGLAANQGKDVDEPDAWARLFGM